MLGLLAYAIGALAMTVAQSLTAIIIFWAIIGGLGASLLLPAMQSLIHGNFEGAARKKAYALVGAAAAIAAAVGPLLGGFVTTYLSWRVGFALEVVIIAVVLSADQARPRRRRTPGRGRSTWSARSSRSSGMGGVVLGILVWQEGGECGRPADRDRRGRARAPGLVARAAQARGQADAARPGPVPVPALPTRDLRADDAADHARRRDDRAPDLPADDARVQRDEAGLSLAPLSLSMFGVALLAGRKAGKRRPANIVLVGFALSHGRHGT